MPGQPRDAEGQSAQGVCAQIEGERFDLRQTGFAHTARTGHEALAGREELPGQPLQGVFVIPRQVAEALAEFRSVVVEPWSGHEVVRFPKWTRKGAAERAGEYGHQGRIRQLERRGGGVRQNQDRQRQLDHALGKVGIP